MQMADRMSRMLGEGAFEVLDEVKRLEAEGKDIISFAIGDPDFDTPRHIKDAAIAALEDNQTHYCPTAGIPELRQAVAEYISQTRGVTVSPEEVIIAPGAKPLLFMTILATAEAGCEVLYPNPGFPTYADVIRFADAKPVPVPLREEREFRMSVDDIRQRVTDRTCLLIINSPHNPTGSVLTREDVEAIAGLALKHDLWVLSDEIYSRLVYEGEHFSILSVPGMKERVILVDGFSKTYSMTGWRLGYGVMNRQLAERIETLAVNAFSCTVPFIQRAGLVALTSSQEPAEAMKRELKERRDLMVDALNALPGIRCMRPSGAFYVYANVTAACKKMGCKDAKEFQQRMLYEAQVAVLPRIHFGPRPEDETQEYVRFSYVVKKERIVEGMERLKKWLRG